MIKDCYTTRYNLASTKSISETFLIAGKFIAPDTVYHLNETLPFALNSQKKEEKKQRKEKKKRI